MNYGGNHVNDPERRVDHFRFAEEPTPEDVTEQKLGEDFVRSLS